MTDIITPDDLASWLRDPSLSDDEALIQIVGFTNGLIEEEWATPVDPVPARITLLALGVAARAWRNNPAVANIESSTVSVDDGSRTVRYRSTTGADTVYLTNDELAILQGKPAARSVRLVSYGDH